MEPQSNNLELLMQLMDRKKIMLENIKRLTTMSGRAIWNSEKVPKCHAITFVTEYGPHCQASATFDVELIDKLLDISMKYYQEKLTTIDLLIGLAEKAVQKEIGPQLTELLIALEGK